jgi:hypothetical protein
VAGDHTQRSGLSAARWAKQTTVTAGLDAKIDMINRNHFSVAFGYGPQLNQTLTSQSDKFSRGKARESCLQVAV